MIKQILSLLSPAGDRARLPILIFHRVLATADPLQPDTPDAARFDAICCWLKDWFQVLPLDQAVQRLKAGTLPARAAAITFDDGYADNHDVAMPILLRHGLTATFFVATGYLDGGRMFNDSVSETLRRTELAMISLEGTPWAALGPVQTSDLASRRRSINTILPIIKPWEPDARTAFCEALRQRAGVANLPNDLMMSSGQVQALAQAGMQVGAHTMSHPILASLDDQAAQAEILGSRLALESLLGQPVTLFAYPNGRPGEDYRPRTVDLVRRAGFEAAVSTAWGVSRQSSDCLELPRLTPWDHQKSRFGLRMLKSFRH